MAGLGFEERELFVELVLEERELDVELELDGEWDLRVRLLPHEMGSGSGPCGSLVFPHEKRLQGVGAKFGSGSRGP